MRSCLMRCKTQPILQEANKTRDSRNVRKVIVVQVSPTHCPEKVWPTTMNASATLLITSANALKSHGCYGTRPNVGKRHGQNRRRKSFIVQRSANLAQCNVTLPQHFLNFSPDPQGQSSFLPILGDDRRCVVVSRPTRAAKRRCGPKYR